VSQATATHADSVEMRLGGELYPITPFLSGFTWTESLIRGGWFWSLDFAADAWAEWTPLLLGRSRTGLQFRMATQEDGEHISTEWRSAYVDNSRTMFRGTTMLGHIEGADRRLELEQVHRIRAFSELTTAEIVRAIGLEHGMEVIAEATSERRIRTLQIQETDWAFLRRLALEEASQSGRGDLYLWIDENELHLGAPVLQKASDRKHDMDRVENRVDRLILSYAGRGIDRMGGATLRAIGFDFDTKRGISYDVDLGASQTHPSLAGRVPRAQSDGLRVAPVSCARPGRVEAAARGRWGKLAPRYFGLRVDTRPDLTLHPGRILEMQASLGEDQETPFMGRFVVLEVQHAMVRGSITTTAVCYRREAFIGEEEPSGSKAENVQTRDPYIFGSPTTQRVIVTAEELD